LILGIQRIVRDQIAVIHFIINSFCDFRKGLGDRGTDSMLSSLLDYRDWNLITLRGPIQMTEFRSEFFNNNINQMRDGNLVDILRSSRSMFLARSSTLSSMMNTRSRNLLRIRRAAIAIMVNAPVWKTGINGTRSKGIHLDFTRLWETLESTCSTLDFNPISRGDLGQRSTRTRFESTLNTRMNSARGRLEFVNRIDATMTVHRLTGVPVSCLHGGTLPKSSKQQQQEIDYDFSNQSYYSNYMEIKHRMENELSIRYEFN
jgi:hypothetical protein